MSKEKRVSQKEKLVGLIKLARPQFLIAYFIVAIGGLTMGFKESYPIDLSMAVFAIFNALLSAIGVHFRDEAGDWASGYDKEIGGMGIIRDRIFTEDSVRTMGRILSSLTILLGLLQALIVLVLNNQGILFMIGIPIIIMIIFVNYLTEEIPLGHEIITAGSYFATFYWVFFSQSWVLTPSVLFFSLFLYLIVFALIPYQDIADLEADAKTGKKTLASKLGLDGVGHLAIFIGLLSFLLLYVAILI
ncbi:hypothetical protein [Candidatus Hodarchaeum mangrovi]|nr:hypothetical protein [Asgard group archaeon]